MQHQIDEYAVTDVRHTVSEALRVARERRWHFFIPFCIVGTVAFAASMFIPRYFTATTVLRRDNDAVLANMLGRVWKEPYGEIKSRMASDLGDVETILAVLDELDLPQGLERFEDGSLTSSSVSARLRLAKQVASGLVVKPMESTPARDVMSVRLSLEEGTLSGPILALLRDRYLAKSREHTSEILQNAKRFLQVESDRSRSELSDVHKELTALELKYPGINPNEVDPNQSELSALNMERISLDRQKEQFRQHHRELESALKSLRSGIPSGPVAGMTMLPNPRRAELAVSLGKLRQELTTLRTTKRMTEAHPSVVQLRSSIESMEAELAITSAHIDTADEAGAGDSSSERLEHQIVDMDGKLAATRARSETVEHMVSEVERRRAESLGRRDEYLRLSQKADRIGSELKTWQDSMKPVMHMQSAENSGRTIQFATVRDIEQSGKPSSPTGILVIGICLAIATAVGACVVLAGELMDHSYRTVKHLSSSLGVPVIESIDLILTEAGRKRRLARNILAVPALATLLLIIMIGAGAAAYMSLEQPTKLAEIQSSPHRAIQIVLEPTGMED